MQGFGFGVVDGVGDVVPDEGQSDVGRSSSDEESVGSEGEATFNKAAITTKIRTMYGFDMLAFIQAKASLRKKAFGGDFQGLD